MKYSNNSHFLIGLFSLTIGGWAMSATQYAAADTKTEDIHFEQQGCSRVDPDANIEALGIVLTAPPAPTGNYVPVVRAGKLLFLSGNVPRLPDGSFITGKLGDKPGQLSIDAGSHAARVTIINQLSVLKAELGELKRVKRIVKVFGMVNSDPDFTDQPKVINGASDLLVDIFGACGKHARAAVGMVSLPFGIAVEIDMVVELY